jgi:hypothetical protein
MDLGYPLQLGNENCRDNPRENSKFLYMINT